MKRFYLLYNPCDGLRVVDKDGKVVCGKGYGTVIPYWDNAQAMSVYEQVENVGTKDEMIEELKKGVFFKASHRDRGKRRKRMGA